ncbi:hypothetical protein ACU4GR_17145 [Methylobacterium oryzae CBMB20]
MGDLLLLVGECKLQNRLGISILRMIGMPGAARGRVILAIAGETFCPPSRLAALIAAVFAPDDAGEN